MWQRTKEARFGAYGLVGILGMTTVLSAGAASAAEPVGDETFEGGFVCAATPSPTHCQSVINPSLPSFDLALVWHVEEGSGLHVLDRIDIRRKGEAEPFQSVSGIESSLPESFAHNGFEMLDLNFDGYLDMRVVQFLPAGPNIPYQNWLWSERDEQFVAIPALDAITSPQFDADAQEITSQWRSSAAEYGSDIYVYESATPVLIHRETDTMAEGGVCARVFYDRIDGELRKTGTGACAE